MHVAKPTFDIVDIKIQLQDPWYQLVLKMLLSVVSDFRNREILEVGCGLGGFCINVGRKGSNVVGVDVSKTAVRKGRDLARLQGAKEQVDFIVADALHLPFNEGTKEIVVCSETLEHVLDPEKALNELVRVTEKSGYLCLTVPNLLSSLLLEFVILRMVGQPEYVKQKLSVEKEDIFNIFRLRKLLDRDDVKVMRIRSTDFFHVPPRVKHILRIGRSIQTASERVEDCLETHNLPFKLMGANLGVLVRKEDA